MERLSFIIIVKQPYFLCFGLRLEIGTTCRDQASVVLGRVADIANIVSVMILVSSPDLHAS